MAEDKPWTCQYCGQPLPAQDGPRRDRRYCSAAHRQRAYERRQATRRFDALARARAEARRYRQHFEVVQLLLTRPETARLVQAAWRELASATQERR